MTMSKSGFATDRWASDEAPTMEMPATTRALALSMVSARESGEPGTLTFPKSECVVTGFPDATVHTVDSLPAPAPRWRFWRPACLGIVALLAVTATLALQDRHASTARPRRAAAIAEELRVARADADLEPRPRAAAPATPKRRWIGVR